MTLWYRTIFISSAKKGAGLSEAFVKSGERITPSGAIFILNSIIVPDNGRGAQSECSRVYLKALGVISLNMISELSDRLIKGGYLSIQKKEK